MVTAYVVRVRGQSGSWKDWFHVDASKPHAERKAEAEFERMCQQTRATDVVMVRLTEDTLGYRRADKHVG